MQNSRGLDWILNSCHFMGCIVEWCRGVLLSYLSSSFYLDTLTCIITLNKDPSKDVRRATISVATQSATTTEVIFLLEGFEWARDLTSMTRLALNSPFSRVALTEIYLRGQGTRTRLNVYGGKPLARPISPALDIFPFLPPNKWPTQCLIYHAQALPMSIGLSTKSKVSERPARIPILGINLCAQILLCQEPLAL